METTLSVSACELSEALPFLVQVTRPKMDTCAGLATVQDICANSHIFKVKDEAGNAVMAFALEPYVFHRGTMLFVTAGAGAVDGIDLTDTIHKVVETQARHIGAKYMGLMTRRKGLIKKLTAKGWTVAGVKLVKKL